MKLRKNEQGFTIIEVVLVLAIAGLIFLMVFIALPALQRGQRDNGRKNDISVVASAVNTFKSNNKNSIGTTATTGLTTTTLASYIDSLGQYGSGAVTVLMHGTPTTIDANSIRVYKGSKCGVQNNTATPVLAVGTPDRTAAVVGGLENNGSQIIVYCQDV